MVPLTKLMRVVLAALHLEERNLIPFSAEDIIIEAWKRWPEEFGMKNYEQEHPCTRSVYKTLEGPRGLIAKAFLQPSPIGGYTLTVDGRELAYEIAAAHKIILHRSAPNPAPANGLSPRSNASLHRMLDSDAYSLGAQGMVTEITYRQAMNFWDIEDESMGEVLVTELKDFDDELDKIELVLKAVKGSNILLDNSREVVWQDLVILRDVNTVLRLKFARHLKAMTERILPAPPVTKKKGKQ